MKKHLEILLAAIVAIGPAAASASELPEVPYVRCVQSELQALGMSGVKVTGRVDGPSRAAAAAFQAQYLNAKGLALLPKLNKGSAVGWCREIAVVKPAVRKFMPSASAPLVLGPEGGGNRPKVMLLNTFNNVEGYFRKVYGIHTASRVDIAGAGRGDVLAGLAVQLQRQRGVSYGKMGERVGRVCRTPSRGYGGQAWFNQLLICWPVEKKFDAAWAKKVTPRVGAIMAHEYMHHIQYELANFKTINGGSFHRSKMGPGWMVEGGAELGEYNWKVSRGGFKRLSLEALQKDAAENPKGLRAMNIGRNVKGRKDYHTARFAVWLLAQRFGEEKVIDYWRFLGQGKNWEAAFKASFGMSMGQYSTLFDSLRQDPAKARAFIAGS